MLYDSITWSIIGLGKNSFCSYKVKIDSGEAFCRNPYNVTGKCSKTSCPLVNFQYATVLETKNKLYLCMKTEERKQTPLHQWERVELPSNFKDVLRVIDSHLMWWSKTIRLRCKQRAVRLTQMLIRRKKNLAIDRGTEWVRVHKKVERRVEARERKAIRTLRPEGLIEKELLKRLREGAYDAETNCDTQDLEELFRVEQEAEKRRKKMKGGKREAYVPHSKHDDEWRAESKGEEEYNWGEGGGIVDVEEIVPFVVDDGRHKGKGRRNRVHRRKTMLRDRKTAQQEMEYESEEPLQKKRLLA